MRFVLVTCGVLAAFAAWSAWQPQSGPASSAVADDVSAVLVEFGVTDKAPAAWDGELSVTGGEIVRIESWRPLPKESLDASKHSWKMSSSWSGVFQNRAWEEEPMTPYTAYLRRPGLVVQMRGSRPALQIRTPRGEFRTDVAGGAYLNGAVLVTPVPAPVNLSAAESENEHVALAREAGGPAMWMAWVTYRGNGNQVFVRRQNGSQWSAAESLTGAQADIFRVQLGTSAKAGVWAIWNEQVNGNWDLYGRQRKGNSWGPAQRLTEAPQPDIHHAVTADSNGNLWVVWQGFRDGQSDVFARRFDGSAWSPEERVSSSPANDWSPAVAADSKGRVHVAWDTYDKGNYDVAMRTWAGGQWNAQSDIASTPKFEAKVVLACDREDRLWAAWNEAGLQWGKDTGLLVRRPGTPLYSERMIATAVLDGGKWTEPAPFEASLPNDLQDRNESMTLAADGSGRMWLLFRHRLPLIPGIKAEAALHGAGWEVWATTYEGSKWSKPVSVPGSVGRSDMATAAVAGADGALRVAWASDSRNYQEMIHRRANVFSGKLPALPGTPAAPVLTARVQPTLRTFPGHPTEKQEIERVRAYTIASGGKTYRIYRGDIHRHTEISRDGKNDGSLWDTYRYALDAASLDFLGVSDHSADGGPDISYINYLQQQACDIFFVSGRFTPLYGYERSLNYPNGHRNVMFAKRGVPTLPIPPEERQARTGAQALYEYLKKNKGIAVSHTSASNMGTDWRDNDPEVEPLVEIYQGDRVSAEHDGAPKAATKYDPTSHAGGFRPEGYVWNAWAKGYKLGVQASSDHLSTHISYACTIATGPGREDLIQAMRDRHSYGATDNIILDYRLQADGREYLQGDIVEVKGPFRLHVKVIGTAGIRQIDIIRSNTYLHTKQNLPPETDFTFVDANPVAGESYYYVRVQQMNEQMAWSSPIWIKR